MTAPTAAPAGALRHAHVPALLGPGTAQRLREARILVVGAGGIGCELLKNLAMVGMGRISVIDLDTIDLSNLNRQFLFQKQHIGQPKALVAAAAVRAFRPDTPIDAYHDTIFAPAYGFAWFAQFDIVLNALDNLEARRWVNKLCVATRTPLIESGTTGFWGQVQPIVPFQTECYDCTPKPTPKSYPVCTIRSTPSQPIHTIVWAKSWLVPQLFGADDETEEQELQKALANGENADEISKLQSESGEMRAVRDTLQEPGAAERVFSKLYTKDIERLLARETMWKTRAKPTPLRWEDTRGAESVQSEGLRDHQQLTLSQTVDLFESALSRLTARQHDDPEPITFDKDDDDVMDFVCAAANLRSWVYAIPRKTRFETKEMAGNIIPAIASTNAVVAAQIVMQAISVLMGRRGKYVHLTRMGNRLLSGAEPSTPNPRCPTCSENYGLLTLASLDTTLADVLDAVALRPRSDGGLGFEKDEEGFVEIGVYNGTRLLLDVDMDDNLPRTLASLQVQPNTLLTFTDERDDPLAATNLFLALDPAQERRVVLSHLDVAGLKSKPPPPTEEEEEEESDSGIESAGEEDVEVLEVPGPRKRKASPPPATRVLDVSKKTRTE